MTNRIHAGATTLTVLLSVCASAASAFAQTVTIDFGTSTTSLPYFEDSFTVTSLSGGGTIGGFDGDAELVGGTNTVAIRWQVTGSEPFTLESLDVENIFRPWRFEAAGAQTVNITSAGTVDFSGVPGWQGISSFQIIHDPGQANGTATIDNIVATVPEPAGVSIGAAGVAALLLRRRHRPDVQ